MISRTFNINDDQAKASIKWSLSQTGEPYSLSKNNKITIVFENNRHMDRWSKNHWHLIYREMKY